MTFNVRIQKKPAIGLRVLPRIVPNDGEDATIAIGTVTTLTPGSPATVQNVGTPGAAIFNFGIPQGTAGTPGAAGVVQSITGSGITVDSTNPAIPALSITDDAVSNAKLANMATSRVKGRATASTGDPEDLTLTQVLDMVGSAAQGDILYRGASAWSRLAKGTALQVLRQNSALTAPEWATAREVLTAARTYYVRTDGSDSNNGLANTSGGAFLTIQKALNVVLGTLDLAGFNVTIQVAAGTYTGSISFASPQVGAGNITINGDTTTPSNVTVGFITVDGAGCRLFISGLNVDKVSAQYCISATNGGYIKTVTNNQFSSTSAGHRMLSQKGGVIDAVAPEIVAGTCAGGHYRADMASTIYCQGATWTASGTATQGYFAGTANGGVIYAFSNTSSGTFSGQRYNASMNGVIQSNGGGASYFPGSTAGATATGGQYA